LDRAAQRAQQRVYDPVSQGAMQPQNWARNAQARDAYRREMQGDYGGYSGRVVPNTDRAGAYAPAYSEQGW
jgi:hypothetical protein